LNDKQIFSRHIGQVFWRNQYHKNAKSFASKNSEEKSKKVSSKDQCTTIKNIGAFQLVGYFIWNEEAAGSKWSKAKFTNTNKEIKIT
jgi:hypothetical protein